jgi:Arc/MetJ-type ribon-helix-helix transcriptional regulator
MNITLPTEQERWLKKRIANGEFQSAEDAVRQLIAERIEARAAIARGDKVSLEEAELDIDRVLESLNR